MEFSTVRAVVTGGARGMGREFAEQIVAEGGKAFFCDLDGDAVAATTAENGIPGTAANVADEADVARMFDEAEVALGGTINVLVNNAGITRDHLLVRKDRKTGELQPFPTDMWNQVIAVNLTGPFFCMRSFAERLIAKGEQPAVAVNISSISRHGNRGQSNYSAAKAGVVADTKLWAEELARYGIRVGAVAPGFTATPMTAAMRQEHLDRTLSFVPLGRAAQPYEIWQGVKFVIACDYFTARVVAIDGGLPI